MIKYQPSNNKQNIYVIGLFLLTLLFSQINIPFISSGSLPDYLVAWSVGVMLLNNKQYGILTIFFAGLIADIFIGQYAFTFILTYAILFFIQKMFAIQSYKQRTITGIILVIVALLTTNITSTTYQTNFHETSILLKLITTIITFLVYQLIIYIKLKEN